MRIILLRHGRSVIPEWRLISAYELQNWIKAYNGAGIDATDRPSQYILDVARNCDTVVCSDVPRSIESARLLGFESPDVADPLFREMGLPYGNCRFPKLPTLVWAGLSRMFWFLGYAQNSESNEAGQIRAAAAAERLIQIAHTSGCVLFVGHGLLNKYIAGELLRSGWRGPKNPGLKHWEFGIYEFSAAK